MISKSSERLQAIDFRQRGLSYSEIRERIPVAKSTLSLWFKEVSLSHPQKQRLTEKKRLAGLRGALQRHNQRVELRNKIVTKAAAEIGHLSERELWLIGTALYWAEGSKEKDKRSSRVQFGNSDPLMIKLFIRWMIKVCRISPDQMRFDLYIHEGSKNSIESAKEYWNNVIKCSTVNGVYFKKGNPKTKRANTGSSYFGLLRVTVFASIELNRRIEGWVKGINEITW